MTANNQDQAKLIFSLLDLTNLNDTDTEDNIKLLCSQASSSLGHVAAVCIYPQFVTLAKKTIKNAAIKIATVGNFPQGNKTLAIVMQEIKQAIADGADEIDVVMPYQDYLAGKTVAVKNFITACKTACGKNTLLKVILETGVLQKPEIITNACRDVILSGADFIKTSTGKTAINATPEAAEAMLTAIKELKLSRPVGLKVSGSIRTVEQAQAYIRLAEKIMGNDWINPNHFRIGASSLHLVLASYL